jgi:hypothetical protein
MEIHEWSAMPYVADTEPLKEPWTKPGGSGYEKSRLVSTFFTIFEIERRSLIFVFWASYPFDNGSIW